MSVRCKHVQQALAAGTAEELGADALLQKHLSGCAACSELQTALEVVDSTLGALPPLGPPIDLVARVLAESGTNAPTVQLVPSGPGDLEAERDSSPAASGENRGGRALAMAGAFAAAAAVLLVSASSFLGSGDRQVQYTPPETLAVNSPVGSNEVTYGALGLDAGPMAVAQNSTGLVVIDGSGSQHGEGESDNKNQLGLDKEKDKVGFLEKPRDVPPDDGKGKSGEGQVVLGKLLEKAPTTPAATPKPPAAHDRIGGGKHQITLRSSPTGGEVTIEGDRGESGRGGDEGRDARSKAGQKVTRTVTAARSEPDNGVAIDQDFTKNIPVPARSFESKLDEAVVKGETKKVEKAKEQLQNKARQQGQDRWRDLQWSADEPAYYRYQNETNGKEVDRQGLQSPAKSANKQIAGKRRKGQQGPARSDNNDIDQSVRQPATKGRRIERELTRDAAQSALTSESRGKKKPPVGDLTSGATARQSYLARVFLAERTKHVGVATVGANGFWSNNYIPGDPRLRLLAARLASDPSAQQIGSLDEAVAPYPQSFDAPKNSALAVSVRSDRRASDGPARMLIQVGLSGTARRAGGRPALNVGVVLDLGGATETAATSMRAVLSALRAAKRRGDRFSLTVANRPGGLVVRPDQFRNGPLRVAMRTLFSSRPGRGRTLDLVEAVKVATAQVAAADDPSGPLGRSMVVIVTASTTSVAIDRALERLAHANATNGIGLSAIGVGTAIDDRQLLRWAAAGHGNRRLLARSADAKAVVASELASAESVVARAVRVRVKLAAGVKLVGVVGAKRLGAVAAARTREAEKSIDRRVAKARGITSDRERDSDGVKVIIPSFSAGDSHVILLDVIADGPGALADVSVTYKDLVHLRNGNAKSSLSLQRGRHRASQLERGVFQNYVGLVISERLAAAGERLGISDNAGATRVVAELHDLLRGLRVERPWLRRDAAFGRDVATVAGYESVLRGGVTSAAEAYVANSLSYAAWRKVVRVRREAN